MPILFFLRFLVNNNKERNASWAASTVSPSANRPGPAAACELNYYHDDDGSLDIRARLPAEEGAVVLQAINAAMDAQRPGEDSIRGQVFDFDFDFDFLTMTLTVE